MNSQTLSKLLSASCVAVMMTLSPALAQDKQKPFEPEYGQQGKDVVWVPTAQGLVDRMLDMAKLTAKDIHYDLGSGDGRNIIAAARLGARALGVEFNPDMVALARAAGKPVIIDTKGTDFERYRGATVITPNMGEFEAVVGHCASDADVEAKGQQLRASLDLQAVLVTRSEKGMSLMVRDQPAVHISTRAQEVFDVTGAGDSVVATLGAALAAGLSLPLLQALGYEPGVSDTATPLLWAYCLLPCLLKMLAWLLLQRTPRDV